jgi:hypothetical protein
MAATVALRFVAAIFLPLTGDEAYYILWGAYPSIGYYDHPPLIGWVHVILNPVFGNSVLPYRLLAILAVTFVAWVLALMLRPIHRERANLVASIYLVSPLNFLFIISCPEIAVLVSLILSAYFLQKAMLNDRPSFAVIAGVFLGLAAIGKYISVLAVPGLIAWTIYSVGWLKALRYLLLLALPSAIGAGISLWTAYQTCWSNIRFNFNRLDAASGIQWNFILAYLGTLLFVGLPFLFAYYYRRKSGNEDKTRVISDQSRIVWNSQWISLGVIALMLLISLRNVVGLHWLLSFYPFAFAALMYMPQLALWKSLKVSLAITLVLLSVASFAPRLPTERLKDWVFYPDVVISKHPEKVCAAIDDFVGAENYQPATREYSHASILEVMCNQAFATLEVGSRYGRSYDFFADPRTFDGKLVVYLSPRPIESHRMGRILENHRIGAREIEGATFHMIAGTFNYAIFRELVFETVWERYYSKALPLPEAKCYMRDRYGFGS